MRAADLLASVDAALGADTGWLNITAAAGYTSNGAQVRQIGNQVFFRGNITINSGNFAAAYTGCGTLPAGITVPPTYKRVPTAGYASANANGLLIIMSAGSSTIQGAGVGASANVLYLDNFSYLTN